MSIDQLTQSVLDDLGAVSLEISRINRQAGQTVFNPAATEALRGLIRRIEEGEILISD